MTLRLGVLASHNGSNLQAIIDSCATKAIDATVEVVISNNSAAYALTRAADAGIPTRHISTATHPDPKSRDITIATALRDHHVDVVCLAGYMKQLGSHVITEYQNRILNIHRAPLPRFGGPGMYGRAILEAVLSSGVTEAGAAVHIVDEEYDQGPVIAFSPMPVYRDDTVETLETRVLALEHRLYPETLGKIARGEIVLPPAGSTVSP